MRARSRSSNGRGQRGLPRGAGALLAALVAGAAAGCDGSSPPPAVIIDQPTDQLLFEGQGVLFRVRATGTDGLTYQWRRDGLPIPGAIDSHLAIARVVPEDDGAVFSVSVTNLGADPVESQGARLTVHPPLDLRFQWVDAPFLPSYGFSSNLLMGWAEGYRGVGTPLLIGTGFCGATGNCDWYYAVDPTVPGMMITYEAASMKSYFGPGWAAALPSDTIVTSLDLQLASDAFAASLSQTTQAGEFAPVVQDTVAPDQLQAVATSEGAQGRVLTAVSFQGGQVTYVSYGWTRAASAVYEARVVATPFGAVAAAAEGLAAEGYVITACGAGDGGANGLLLVGTRAPGQTSPRSILLPAHTGLLDGHALVAFVFDPATGTTTLVGEK